MTISHRCRKVTEMVTVHTQNICRGHPRVLRSTGIVGAFTMSGIHQRANIPSEAIPETLSIVRQEPDHKAANRHVQITSPISTLQKLNIVDRHHIQTAWQNQMGECRSPNTPVPKTLLPAMSHTRFRGLTRACRQILCLLTSEPSS